MRHTQKPAAEPAEPKRELLNLQQPDQTLEDIALDCISIHDFALFLASTLAKIRSNNEREFMIYFTKLCLTASAITSGCSNRSRKKSTASSC